MNSAPQTPVRDDLVRLSHQFLIKVLPFRVPHSREALANFTAALESLPIVNADLDAVLLRLLAVLSRRAERLPTLIERYLSDALGHLPPLRRFSGCVEDVLRYHCIYDGSVQEAIEQIHTRYTESDCTPHGVATALDLALSALDVTFRREMGRTLTSYIRSTRLDQAAILLATTSKIVKEVWSEVGYNHHSNFDHDFKRHFGCTPKEYRARAIRPAARDFFEGRRLKRSCSERLVASTVPAILIVDDDSLSCAIVGDSLREDGWQVLNAENGELGLEEARRVCPALVFVTYQLSDMDGVAFVRRLRQEPNREAIPVVLFTTDWDLATDREAMRAMHAIAVSKLITLDQICELARSESRATADGSRATAGSNQSRRRNADPSPVYLHGY